MDQATGLRRILTRPTVRVLPIFGHEASDWVSIQLAEALVRLGERVILIEQGDSTSSWLLGTTLSHSIDDFLAGRCAYADAVVAAESGVQVALVRDDVACFGKRGISAGQWLGIFAYAPEPADLVLIHCSQPAAVARSMDCEGDILLTTGGSAPAIRAAYLNIKRTCVRAPRYRMVVVGEEKEFSTTDVHAKIAGTAKRFLGVDLEYGGAVPAAAGDPRSAFPEATARAFTNLASRTLGWSLAEFPAISGEGNRLVASQ